MPLGEALSPEKRRSTRRVPLPWVSAQFHSIFFAPHPLKSVHGHVLTVCHLNPNVFVIDNFLTPTE
eukprot:2795091-Rhodomonas_salina.1